VSPRSVNEAGFIEGCVAALLFLAGVSLVGAGVDGRAVHILLGLALIAVGMGVFWRHRWARWLALGACFLAIAAACTVPVLLLLAVPFRGDFDGHMRVNLLWMAAAYVVGAIGYKGLAYFRSEKGRLDYGGGNVDAQTALLGETSSAVMLSTGAWALVIVIAGFFGLGAPGWLFAHARPGPPPPAPVPAAEPTYYPVSRDPAKGTTDSPTDVKYRVLPDLVPLGLCYRDTSSARVVDLAYANVGAGRGYRRFYFNVQVGDTDPPARRGFELTVPDPDSLLTARVGSDRYGFRGTVAVDLDPDQLLKESDEGNNSGRFPISRAPDGTLALPECSSVHLKIVPPEGTVTTAATAPPSPLPPPLPDLVPLGLCARGQLLVGVQFTNRGTHVSGQYQVSQGRTPADLQLADKTYLSVPGPYEDMGFNLGVVSLLVGKRGQSADVTVMLDHTDAIRESNEANNITRARVTRMDDGSLDLPQCDELARHANDPNWVDKGIVPRTVPAAQPVYLPKPRPVSRPSNRPQHRKGLFPDLVALGGCITRERGELAFRVAFGNVGKVGVYVPFDIMDEIASGTTATARAETGSVPPGSLWTKYYIIQLTRGPTVVTIDSRDEVAELDETNNSVSVEITGQPDGSFNLPDCAPQMKQVAHWEAMMREHKGR